MNIVDWQPRRTARLARRIAKDIGGIMLASLLVLAFAYLGGRA